MWHFYILFLNVKDPSSSFIYNFYIEILIKVNETFSTKFDPSLLDYFFKWSRDGSNSTPSLVLILSPPLSLSLSLSVAACQPNQCIDSIFERPRSSNRYWHLHSGFVRKTGTYSMMGLIETKRIKSNLSKCFFSSKTIAIY